MLVGYVIGPFSASNQWERAKNIRDAELVGVQIASLGVMPLIPHANTGNFYGLFTEEFWYKGTAELLHRANFAITVAAIGRKWDHSKGSRDELEACKRWHIPVFHTLHGLEMWLETQRNTKKQ
jgi:hypothetical protein